MLRLEQGYSKHENPYHNLAHAADVAQTTHHILSQSGLAVSQTLLSRLPLYRKIIKKMFVLHFRAFDGMDSMIGGRGWGFVVMLATHITTNLG